MFGRGFESLRLHQKEIENPASAGFFLLIFSRRFRRFSQMFKVLTCFRNQISKTSDAQLESLSIPYLEEGSQGKTHDGRVTSVRSNSSAYTKKEIKSPALAGFFLLIFSRRFRRFSQMFNVLTCFRNQISKTSDAQLESLSIPYLEEGSQGKTHDGGVTSVRSNSSAYTKKEIKSPALAGFFLLCNQLENKYY